MKEFPHLLERLRALDGRGYPAYKSVKGAYRAGGFDLLVDYVQGDPFATPSRVRVWLAPPQAGLPPWAHEDGPARTATADFLNREFASQLTAAGRPRGSGKSGALTMLRPGQEVLDRSSVLVGRDGSVEARFRIGLPARGRRILGHQAADLFAKDIPGAVVAGLVGASLDERALRAHVQTVQDARVLREQLGRHGLVSFVADGSVLPRRSGVDDHPLEANRARAFRSPDALRVTLETRHAGAVSGMGVPAGVTLVVGGGYHGKSTLLRAIERGVYDHVPGDGRERVVTVPEAVKVRAEDGRSVAGTDISNFIGRLPDSRTTEQFTTENASGSTSQAAAIAEALEVGATCLLLDEDTSATNFMIRDARMQRLVAADDEPITPFIDRARELFEYHGVSTILIVGGSGDYFDIADTVIAMTAYEPSVVTEEARRIAHEYPTARLPERASWTGIRARVPLPDSLDPSRGRRRVHIKAPSEERVLFGTQEIELSAVEQIVEAAQTRAMAEVIAWARGRAIDGSRTLAEAVGTIMRTIEADGLDAVHAEAVGDLAAFRGFELAAMLSRVRGLQVR